MRRARTTSGTSHHHKPQEKKETIPEGRKENSTETICLRVKADKTITKITASRSPVKDLIKTFEKLQQSGNHETSTQNKIKSQVGNNNKLTESFKITSRNETSSNIPSISQPSGNNSAGNFSKTSRNENFSDNPPVRNSQDDDNKSGQKEQIIPVKSKPKPTSSRRVWTKLKSGLFGWKYSKTVSVPSKPSHGKLSNISKISTQTRIKNFETNSVTETHQVLPPKTFFWGGAVRQVPGRYLETIVILGD